HGHRHQPAADGAERAVGPLPGRVGDEQRGADDHQGHRRADDDRVDAGRRPATERAPHRRPRGDRGGDPEHDQQHRVRCREHRERPRHAEQHPRHGPRLEGPARCRQQDRQVHHR
ncbi:MAG: hypothetical protein ACK56I_12840, partial [bacterium]